MRYTWRNLILIGIVLTALLALLAGCSSATTTTSTTAPGTTTTAATTTPLAATVKPIELRLAHAWANTHLMHKVIQTWADQVNTGNPGQSQNHHLSRRRPFYRCSVV